jgi:PAS domain S-box-containing protein
MIYKNPEIAQKILEIVPLPLFIKDSKEELIYINQAESQLLGINLNNIPDKDRIHWLKNDLSVILENKIIERIYKFSERYYKVIKYPFEYQKETFIIGIAVDITEIQKSIERLSIFKNVLDNLQDGVILSSNNPQKDYPVIYINKNFIESTGYSKQEVIGKNCRFLAGINPDVDEREKIKDCIRQLIPFEGVVTNYRKNGEEFKNHLRILPLRDLSGQVTLFLGLQKDITENYIYREEISKKEKLYRSIVNSRDDLIFKWRKNGDIYFVNQGFCNFFKKTMEMCIGRKSPFTILDLQISLENPIRKKRNKTQQRVMQQTTS